ncbi:unnamed protein product [Rotaria magnacalcarata]|uniref:EGF-like domain-containing protein n=2 Tax=Rotaria magnacalcarata TaxID=392030 RepID=A0A816VIE2_9BILA|nr:unnamed protein product [Rotaria magnacalcarata]
MTFTFGDGSTQYSNKTPLDFDFNTSYKQVFQSNIRGGKFAFVNRVPDYYDTWYTGELDHTENDNDGYMLLANVEKNNTQLFSYSMNNLCVGLKYEFSAYLANVIRDELNSPKPNVRFEVWTATENGTLLARLCTDSISQCTNMTWAKYGISFVAQNSSVLLLIISKAGGRHGNNLAIDDIKIRVCSNSKSGVCLPGSSSLLLFEPAPCENSSTIGIDCNISYSLCDLTQPCRNNGTCTTHLNDINQYTCLCSSGFNGTHCELDHRPCKPQTCLGHGECKETPDLSFFCWCHDGWTGIHCQSRIDNCSLDTCENDGVCRPILLNYTCECLGDSYSGRHCEIPSMKTTILKTVSKSFAYIAIIAMISVAMFIVIMDILKYCFGMDPTRGDLERIRREKRKSRAIQRLVYTHAPAPPTK